MVIWLNGIEAKFLKSNKINIGCLITHPDKNSSKKKEIINLQN